MKKCIADGSANTEVELEYVEIDRAVSPSTGSSSSDDGVTPPPLTPGRILELIYNHTREALFREIKGCQHDEQATIIDNINEAVDWQGKGSAHLAKDARMLCYLFRICKRKQAFVRCVDYAGNTALHEACARGELSMVKLLVEPLYKGEELRLEHIDLNARNHQQDTAFSVALQARHYDVAHYLLQKTVEVHYCNSLGNTPLHLVCEQGLSNKIFAQLLTRVQSEHWLYKDILENSDGFSPLDLACRHGRLELVEMMLNNSAYMSLERAREDRCPYLHHVAADTTRARFAIGKLLLNADHAIKENINAVDDNQETLLHLAVRSHDVKFVSWVLSHDELNIDKPNHHGDTALHLACELGFTDIANVIFCNSPSAILAVNHQQMTPLQLACIAGHYHLVDRTLDLMPDEDQVDLLRDGSDMHQTLLQLAAAHGHDKVLAKLFMHIDKLGDAFELPKYAPGFAPLELAHQGGHQAAVKVCLQRSDTTFLIRQRLRAASNAEIKEILIQYQDERCCGNDSLDEYFRQVVDDLNAQINDDPFSVRHAGKLQGMGLLDGGAVNNCLVQLYREMVTGFNQLPLSQKINRINLAYTVQDWLRCLNDDDLKKDVKLARISELYYQAKQFCKTQTLYDLLTLSAFVLAGAVLGMTAGMALSFALASGATTFAWSSIMITQAALQTTLICGAVGGGLGALKSMGLFKDRRALSALYKESYVEVQHLARV